MRFALRFVVAVVLSTATVVAGPLPTGAAEPTTIRLATGAVEGPPGTKDVLVLFSLDDVLFEPAVVVDTAGRPYDVLGGSRWVSLNETGTGAPSTPVRYRLPFTLPAGFTGPSLSVAVHADNVAFVELNGRPIGNQTDNVDLADNFLDPADSFRADDASLFLPGTNHLDVLLYNGGDPSGLDLVADVSFLTGGGDPLPRASTIALGDVTVDEGDAGAAQVLVPFTISPPLTAPGSVRFSASPVTATADSDFTSTSGILNLDNGQTSGTIAIPLLPDLHLERNETFTVHVDSPTAGLVVDPGSSTGTVTILDDDPLGLSVQDATGAEGTLLFVPVHFSSPALDPGSVVVSTADGSAASPADYQGDTGRLVSWSAGATEVTAVFPVVDDSLAEGAENFSVHLASPTGGAFLAVATSTATITDNDVPGAAPGLTLGDVTALEGDPASRNSLRFPVTLTAAANHPITFRCRTVAGGSASTFQYTEVDAAVTVPAGATTATCDVPIQPDLVDEVSHTVAVEVTSTSATVIDGQAIGTILDDDPSPPNVRVLSASAALEGDPGGTAGTLAFQIEMSPVQKAPVSVNYRAVPGQTFPTAQPEFDFVATAGVATFAPGQTSIVVMVPVVADLRGEPRESIDFFVSNLQSPGLRTGSISQPISRTFINDDDPLGVNVSLRDAPAVAEGDPGGGGTLSYAVEISSVQKVPLLVDYRALAPQSAPGQASPASVSDFEPTAGTLTIPAGTTQMQLRVPIVGDLRGESSERVDMFLTNLRSDGPRSHTIGRSTAFGIISNDDPTSLNVGVVDAGRVVEGDPGNGGTLTFPVSLSSVQKTEVRVRYRAFVPTGGTPASASDFIPTAGDLIIPAGAGGGTINVPIVGDLSNEPDERVEVTLSDLRSSGAPGLVIGDRTGLGFIVNDDPAAARWRIEDASAVEGSPTEPGVMRLRTSITPAQKVPVATNVVISGDTATAGSDFVSTTARVVIPAGATEAFLEVPLRGDLDVEADERFTARLQATEGIVSDGLATGTIVNDDAPPGVSISDAQASEGTATDGALTFVVTLAFPVSTEVSVDFNTLLVQPPSNTTASAGDLTRISGKLVFSPGETQRRVTVHARADQLDEADETFLVRLLNPLGVQLADRDGVGAIINDDGLRR